MISRYAKRAVARSGRLRLTTCNPVTDVERPRIEQPEMSGLSEVEIARAGLLILGGAKRRAKVWPILWNPQLQMPDGLQGFDVIAEAGCEPATFGSWNAAIWFSRGQNRMFEQFSVVRGHGRSA